MGVNGNDSGDFIAYPMCSKDGIFTYIWFTIGANVAKYSVHGAVGNEGMQVDAPHQRNR